MEEMMNLFSAKIKTILFAVLLLSLTACGGGGGGNGGDEVISYIKIQGVWQFIDDEQIVQDEWLVVSSAGELMTYNFSEVDGCVSSFTPTYPYLEAASDTLFFPYRIKSTGIAYSNGVFYQIIEDDFLFYDTSDNPFIGNKLYLRSEWTEDELKDLLCSP
jgi:hypothetical protein